MLFRAAGEGAKEWAPLAIATEQSTMSSCESSCVRGRYRASLARCVSLAGRKKSMPMRAGEGAPCVRVAWGRWRVAAT